MASGCFVFFTAQNPKTAIIVGLDTFIYIHYRVLKYSRLVLVSRPFLKVLVSD